MSSLCAHPSAWISDRSLFLLIPLLWAGRRTCSEWKPNTQDRERGGTEKKQRQGWKITSIERSKIEARNMRQENKDRQKTAGRNRRGTLRWVKMNCLMRRCWWLFLSLSLSLSSYPGYCASFFLFLGCLLKQIFINTFEKPFIYHSYLGNDCKKHDVP